MYVRLAVVCSALLLLSCAGACGASSEKDSEPSPSASVATSTLTSTPGGTPSGDASGADGFRAFAGDLQAALERRDINFLDDRVKLTSGTCTEADVEGGIGAAPCSEVGETWTAFPTGLWGSEGGYADFSGSEFLTDLYGQARVAESDAFGSPDLRVYAVSISDSAPTTVITQLVERPSDFAGSGPLRLVDVLTWTFEQGTWKTRSALFAAVNAQEFLVPCQEARDMMGGDWERFPDPGASGPGIEACPFGH